MEKRREGVGGGRKGLNKTVEWEKIKRKKSRRKEREKN